MRSVFVDTSAFVALRNAAEAEHEPARAALSELLAEGAALFTSNYVFAETYTALMVRVGRGEAIEWGRRFRASGAIELVRLDEDVEGDAWEILERHGESVELRRCDLLRSDRARRRRRGVRLRRPLRPARPAGPSRAGSRSRALAARVKDSRDASFS